MFVVSEAEAAANRAVYERQGAGGDFELRKLVPGITDATADRSLAGLGNQGHHVRAARTASSTTASWSPGTRQAQEVVHPPLLGFDFSRNAHGRGSHHIVCAPFACLPYQSPARQLCR